MTASRSATRRFSSATPSGCVRSSVTSSLLRFINWNHGIFSYFCSAMNSARRSVPRHQSGYWQASTLMISAPRSPRCRAAVGPGPAHGQVDDAHALPAAAACIGRVRGRRSGAGTNPFAPRPRRPTARCRRCAAASRSGAAAAPAPRTPRRRCAPAQRRRARDGPSVPAVPPWSAPRPSAACIPGRVRTIPLPVLGLPDRLEQRIDLLRVRQAVDIDGVARVLAPAPAFPSWRTCRATGPA